SSEVQLPRLADKVVTEAVVRLLLDQVEACPFVDVSGGLQHVGGPERDLAIAHLASEAHAFAHQAPAQALPAHLRLDEQHAHHRAPLSIPGHRIVLLTRPLPPLAAWPDRCQEGRRRPFPVCYTSPY